MIKDTFDSEYFDVESSYNKDYNNNRRPGEHIVQFCWRTIVEHLNSFEEYATQEEKD